MDHESHVRRGQRADVVVVDLDHLTDDINVYLDHVRAQLPGSRLVVIGSPLRIAAIDGVVDAELESQRADLPELAAVIAGRTVRASNELAREHRLWAQLTERQRQVLRHLANGSDNYEIARQLDVGVRAVKSHITALLELFSVERRTELALIAHRAGMQPHSD